jgi:ABC-type transport system substrate-binding protein
MWKKNLNVETEIIVKDQAEFVAAFQNGEFDIVRRGVVLSTTDETANMLIMFPVNSQTKKESGASSSPGAVVSSDNQILNEKTAESNLNIAGRVNLSEEKSDEETATAMREENAPFLTEREALEMLPAIPLYFPTSYSLVKPYVQGFEMNALDAPSLKNVKINNNWQPANQKLLSNNQN